MNHCRFRTLDTKGKLDNTVCYSSLTWLESLTQKEIDAIKIYTGNDYKVINQYLRGQIDQLPT